VATFAPPRQTFQPEPDNSFEWFDAFYQLELPRPSFNAPRDLRFNVFHLRHHLVPTVYLDAYRVAAKDFEWLPFAAEHTVEVERPESIGKPTVDEFIAWLDSEDFGEDAERIRREAWGRGQ
jgi:hypothetical protein